MVETIATSIAFPSTPAPESALWRQPMLRGSDQAFAKLSRTLGLSGYVSIYGVVGGRGIANTRVLLCHSPAVFCVKSIRFHFC